jgi:potassium efflux system protein
MPGLPRAQRREGPHRRHARDRLSAGVVLLGLLACASSVLAGPPGAAVGTDLTLAEVEARRSEAAGGAGQSSEDRARVLALYDEAKALLEGARAHAEATAAYQASIEAAPRETERIRQRLGELGAAVPTAEGLGLSAATSPEEIEQRLTAEEGEEVARASALRSLEEQIATQSQRPARARSELAEARRDLAVQTEALLSLSPVGESPAASRATRTLIQARVQARAAELARLDQELVSHGVRLALLTARRDVAARELALARERVRTLQRLASEARRQEAQEAVERAAEAVREASAKHAIVREAAEENVGISRRTAAVAAGLDVVLRQVTATEDRAARLERDFRRTRQRVELAGLSTAVARMLMQERRGLSAAVADGTRILRQVAREPAATPQEAAAVTGLEVLDVDERRRALTDLEGAAEDAMERVEPTMPEDERQALRRELLDLLGERQALLAKLDGVLSAYLRALGELDFARARLETVARAYQDYLDGRLLWIPSTFPLTEGSLENLRRAVVWLQQPEHWQGVRVALASDLQGHPDGWALLALGVVGLGAAAPRLRRRLKDLAERVRSPQTDGFKLTLQALGLTALVALPVPLALAVLGWRLEAGLEATDFSRGLGVGLATAAHGLFLGLVLLVLLKPWGVAGAHFRWPEAALRHLRPQVRLFLAAAVPAVLVATSVGRFADETYSVSLGRTAFLVAMVVIAYVLARSLSPRGAVVRPYLSAPKPQRFARLWVLWYPAVVGTPLALAGLAAWGYYYTASELARPATQTLALAFGALLLYSLGLRWLTVVRRDLVFKLARENLETEVARRTRPDGAPGPSPVASASADLAAIDSQTRQVFTLVLLLGGPVVLWLVWSHVLPAFDPFRGAALWHYTEVVDGKSESVPITLGSVLLAVVIGVVAGAMARSLPAVLEVVLLRHLSLARGSRYAIKTLLQYAIATLGVLLAFGTLGLSWSKVQWLVAALSVGLGFGLQEIVANFVSGIIILFERPIRVGDWVTVGNLTGTVSNISIRATTITDFDRKEILVPNKSLITTDVVNWSLTDPITRIKVLVGIAYGSDVRKAHRVMLDTLGSLPLVRSDPEPRAWFVGFGASSLDFEVHAFASELADRMPLTHAVHMAIEEALRENGIEIAFPQHDLHLRSVSPEAGAALAGLPVAPPPEARG